MTTFAGIRQNLDRRLYRKGFASSEVRQFLGMQILLTATGLLLGIVLAWFTLWPLVFGAGAAITTYSLWHIARFAQAHIQQEFSRALAIRLFFGFICRLVVISIVLFVLVVLLKVPVAPLLAGLTSTVVSISLWGLSRFSRKPVKEA